MIEGRLSGGVDFSRISVWGPGFSGAGADAGRAAAPSCFVAGGIPLLRKLAVGAVNDPLEVEADSMAERVVSGMARAGPVSKGGTQTLRRKCSCGGSGHGAGEGECESCRQKREGGLNRKAAGPAAAEAPQIVHDVLRSPGHPLDSGMRSLMRPRFGFDFSGVRVHTGAHAAESARAVNALAYTVGRDVVFGDGQYRPNTADGRRLLAHELAHVVQQDGAAQGVVRRAPCRSAAACAVPCQGNAAQFGTQVEAESEAIAVASGGVTVGGHTSCTLPRHKDRATNFELLATSAGLGVTIPPGIDGFFINACLSPNVGGTNAGCDEFPGGAPPGTSSAHNCVQVHASDDDMAKTLMAKPKPLRDADLRNFLWIAAAVKHEGQHIHFDTNVGTIVPAAADCNVSTAVPTPGGGTVESLLSEISAKIAEFDVYFKNTQKDPSASGTWAMQSEEHNISVRDKGENILCNIKGIQCACSCATTAKFVEETFIDASGSWTDPEKREFNRAMTDFMPSFWPRSLQVRR